MIEQPLTIINKLGLHARAATKLTSLCNRFASRIHLQANGKEVDCKSVMSLMLLAASQGTDVVVSTDGSDEIAAMEAVQQLINNRFDEAE